MKYVDAVIEFGEVPDEISLCINISGCQIRCPDCHSKYLWENVGIKLTPKALLSLVNANPGISCVCLMGGVEDEILDLLENTELPKALKIAWYTGSTKISKESLLSRLDYLKTGPYDSKLGPLNSRTTNQRFYRIRHSRVPELEDCTYLFWKNE